MQVSESVPFKFMWKVKLPLRIKTFLWLILKGSILTRDVLLDRGGDCTKNCLFCGKDESIDHLFLRCPLARYVWNVVSVATGFSCQFENTDHCLTSYLDKFDKNSKKLCMVGIAAVFWGIWKTRNLACFENKWPSEPIEVVHRICYWIDWWANLQGTEDAKLELQRGARLLARVADDVFKGARGWATWRPRIGEG